MSIIVNYFLIMGTKEFLELNIIGINAQGNPANASNTLYVGAVLMIITGAGGIIVGTLLFFFLRDVLANHIAPNAGASEISLVSFA